VRCPVCKKEVDPIPNNDGYLVCPHCGYVFQREIVGMPVFYSASGEDRRYSQSSPNFSYVSLSATRDTIGSTQPELVAQTQQLEQCIRSALMQYSKANKRLKGGWIVKLILEAVLEHPERKLDVGNLLEKVKDERKKRLISVASSIVCAKCVKCI